MGLFSPWGQANTEFLAYSHVLKYSKLRARPTAESHERKNVRNWLFHRYQGAIFPAEADYVTHTDDLIRVAHEFKTPQRKTLERFKVIIRSNIIKIHQVSYMYTPFDVPPPGDLQTEPPRKLDRTAMTPKPPITMMAVFWNGSLILSLAFWG